MDQFFRIFLPVFLVLFFAVAMAGRSYLLWKKTGVNPYRLGKTESAHDLVGAFFRLVALLVAASVFVYSVLPSVYPWLGLFAGFEIDLLRIAGAVLLVLALVWVSVAQGQMGASWRIGIDTEKETDLVQKGLFRVSRNPIFLGMRLLLLGLFLVTPNVLTIVSLVVGDVLIQVQVRLEEEHMAKLHGDRFEEYKRKVRRWI